MTEGIDDRVIGPSDDLRDIGFEITRSPDDQITRCTSNSIPVPVSASSKALPFLKA